MRTRSELVPPPRAQVLYDGQCPLCLKSVAWLKRLDWLGRLEFHDGRRPENRPPGVAPEQLLAEMHLRPPGSDRLYHGFGAFRWMAWRLPVLWPLAPFLYLPGVPALGQRLYLWVARNRFRLVPCHGGVCTIDPKKSE
jgi:predicted DCC family thiol-disulfide oxidoreductase YuxK